MDVKEHKLKIAKITDETEDTKTFRMEVPEGMNVPFLPGQFFMVRFPDSETFKRAYSIASSPTEKGYIDIGLNLVGDFTKKLFETKMGDELIFRGPYGKFYFSDEMDQDLILLSGGLGITPLKSIVKYCTDKKRGNRIRLIHCVRTPNDIVYQKELDALQQENENFDYEITITRPEEGDGWAGKTGRIDEALLRENISDVKNSFFFLCGSLGFNRSMTVYLEKLGATKEQIKRDVWGNY